MEARAGDSDDDVTHLDEGGEHDVDAVDEELAPKSSWLERGASIDRYVVLECLGVGGMGVIYAVWDPDLDRKLAIKLARTRGGPSAKTSTRGRARLIREAQALARLRHPNVISVHDVGVHDDCVFVAMEYIEGETLSQWLNRTSERDYQRLLSVFLQVGRGLAAAHRAALVHRDVKPDNVMLGRDGRVLVLDFGIAREIMPGEDSQADFDEDEERLSSFLEDLPDPPIPSEDGEDGEDGESTELGHLREPPPEVFAGSFTPLADLTRVGAVIGTPAYMAPEQHRRKLVSSRSDQFAFCIAMWEALNGERPFGGGPREKLLARMRLGQFRPFRRRDVPRRVVAALRRGLSWHPKDRFPTMEALLETLNPRPKGPKLSLAHSTFLGAALFVAGVFGTLAVTHERDVDVHVDADRMDCAAVAAGMDETWNPERASALRAGLIREDSRDAQRWARLEPSIERWTERWRVSREDACLTQAELDRSPATARDDSPASAHDRWVVCLDRQRQTLERTLLHLTRADAGARAGSFTAIATLPEPESCGAPEPSDPETASARALRGPNAANLETELGELELELRSARQPSADLLERSRQSLAAARAGGDEPLLARALLVEGEALHRDLEHRPAQSHLLEAASLAVRLGDEPLQLRAFRLLGASLDRSGEHEDALRWLTLARGLPLAREPACAVPLARALADNALARDRPARARDHLDAARALLEDDPGAAEQLTTILADLARVRAASGDHAGAVGLWREVLAQQTQLETEARDRDRLEVHARQLLARSLAALGQTEAAVGEYERALALHEGMATSADASHEHLASPAHLASLVDLALLAAAQGQTKAAKQRLREATALLPRLRPQELEFASPGVLPSKRGAAVYVDATRLILERPDPDAPLTEGDRASFEALRPELPPLSLLQERVGLLLDAP